jgi:hypothetical protein
MGGTATLVYREHANVRWVYLGILEGRLPVAKVGPLRECRGLGVVQTGAPSRYWCLSGGYHHVRSVFFVSVLETLY